MTDLQVKYQAMLETERANQAREEIQRREAAVKEKLAELDAMQVPYKIQNMLADMHLTENQASKVVSEIGKISSEIDKIRADTALSRQQKHINSYNLLNSYVDKLRTIMGGEYADTLLNSFLKSFGMQSGKDAGIAAAKLIG